MLTVLVRSIHSRKRLSLQRGLTGPASHPSPLVGGTLRVLGIESSCDDSCASIVTSDRQILSNVRLGQNHVHKAFNGIHPYHAIHAHQINLPIAIGRALHQAGLTITQLDAIAYTRGPGIAGCLAVGATAAKSLAAATGLPLVAVHHMVPTHSFIQSNSAGPRILFLKLVALGHLLSSKPMLSHPS